MRSLRSGGAPRHRAPLAPTRLLPLLAALLLVGTSLAPPVVANHGGRGIGSVLACDRPVEPPRCTSVGNDFLHYVVFDASLSDGLAESLRDTMVEDYSPTKLHLIEQPEVTSSTDVIAFSGDFGDNGAAGWVYCPPGSPQGVNVRGDRWCQRQELFFNLNPRFSIFFDDDASRDHVTCHELGHTVGLRHWGNPPESTGPSASTCLNGNTPNGPTSLHELDVDHINAYPYAFWPTPPGVEISRAPDDALAAGAMIEATGTESPRSLDALVAASDAVVHGRVVDVEEGRRFGPASRQLAYAAVTVEVLERLSGPFPAAGERTLVLEVPMFDGPASLSRLRDEMVGTQRILFLRNKGESAGDAGLGADAVATDAGFYRLTAFDSELAVDGSVVWSLVEDASVLEAFDGRSLEDALDELRGARR